MANIPEEFSLDLSEKTHDAVWENDFEDDMPSGDELIPENTNNVVPLFKEQSYTTESFSSEDKVADQYLRREDFLKESADVSVPGTIDDVSIYIEGTKKFAGNVLKLSDYRRKVKIIIGPHLINNDDLPPAA